MTERPVPGPSLRRGDPRRVGPQQRPRPDEDQSADRQQLWQGHPSRHAPLPQAELGQRVGFLGVGSQRDQVGHRHLAGREDGHRQGRAGDGSDGAAERHLVRDSPRRQVEPGRVLELGLDAPQADPREQYDPGQGGHRMHKGRSEEADQDRRGPDGL